MKHFILLFCLLSISLHGIDSDRAHSIFKKKFKNGEIGTFESDGLIYFKVQIPDEGAGHSAWEKSMLTEEALFAHKQLVSSYLINLHSIERPPIPFDSILDKFPNLKSFSDHVNPPFFYALLNFKLDFVLLENLRKDGIFHYSVAYSKEDLIKAAPDEISWPSNSEIIEELRRINLEISKLQRFNQLEKLRLTTNNFIDILKENYIELCKDYNLVSQTDFSEYGHEEFYRLINTASSELEHNNSVANSQKILEKLSLFPPALKNLSNHYLQENPTKSFVLHLVGLPTHSGNIQGVKFEEFNSSIYDNECVFYTNSIDSELNDLVKKIQNFSLPKELLNIPLFRYNFYKIGFHRLNNNKIDNHISYESALDLFNSGKHLNIILSDCLKAIQEDSNHPESWNLLGRSLSLQGFDLLAIPCYIRALTLPMDDYSVVNINLAISLHNIGFIELVKGSAFSVLVNSNPSSWQIKEATRILGITKI